MSSIFDTNFSQRSWTPDDAVSYCDNLARNAHNACQHMLRASLAELRSTGATPNYATLKTIGRRVNAWRLQLRITDKHVMQSITELEPMYVNLKSTARTALSEVPSNVHDTGTTVSRTIAEYFAHIHARALLVADVLRNRRAATAPPPENHDDEETPSGDNAEQYLLSALTPEEPPTT